MCFKPLFVWPPTDRSGLIGCVMAHLAICKFWHFFANECSNLLFPYFQSNLYIVFEIYWTDLVVRSIMFLLWWLLLCLRRNLLRPLNCFEICTLGWAQWNLSSFEFKFDGIRLSSKYKNKICSIEIFLLRPDVALSQFSFSTLRQPTSGCNNFFSNSVNLIHIFWGKSGIIKSEFKPT